MSEKSPMHFTSGSAETCLFTEGIGCKLRSTKLEKNKGWKEWEPPVPVSSRAMALIQVMATHYIQVKHSHVWR